MDARQIANSRASLETSTERLPRDEKESIVEEHKDRGVLLEDGVILKVEQSWDQEKSGYTRVAHVHVNPAFCYARRRFPVLLLFHDAATSCKEMISHFQFLSSRFIIVAVVHDACTRATAHLSYKHAHREHTRTSHT